MCMLSQKQGQHAQKHSKKLVNLLYRLFVVVGFGSGGLLTAGLEAAALATVSFTAVSTAVAVTTLAAFSTVTSAAVVLAVATFATGSA